MSKRHVAVTCVWLFIPCTAWAGAWTLPEGTGQWMVGALASTSTTYFNNNWNLGPTLRYNKVELQALVEYGLTDRLTAIVDPGLQHIDIAPPTSAQRTGLGYMEFGARYAIFTNPSWVVSVQGTLRIPGTVQTSNPAAIGYTDVEADIRGLVGHNFRIAEYPAFFDLEVGERLRTMGYPSEFHADGTLGVKVAAQWMILAQSFNVISEGSGISLFGGANQYYKFQLSALYTVVPTWQLQAGGFTTYAGFNALQENGVILSVWHQF